ncbi:MAG: efflux RND transporter periplasmic adaptor subunit [Leptospiraceae bacterium]|nr:efflux RND transporter periplasmic adaptor subunit [Leptospiraceae bacterium]
MKDLQKLNNVTLINYFLRLICLIGLFTFTATCKKEKEVWYCPMHTTYLSDRPGQCPICNMSLVKQEKNSDHNHKSGEKHESEIKSPTEDSGSNHGNKNEDEKLKLKSIQLSEEKQTLIGIKTSKAEFRNLLKIITAYSVVAYDPELYTAILEYKEAKKTAAIVEPDAQSDSSLLKSSIVRLKQLGLSSSQISEWGNSNRNPEELILGGKNGKAYIYSSLYESDINYIKPGQRVDFKTDSYPDKSFLGNVQSIDSILDEKNRTLRFRSFVSDRGNLLKPQMFGNIEINVPLKKALTVPKSAILNTGKHKIAYVKKENNNFFSVMVKTGIESEGYFEILEGISEGDEVVIESNFLLDSESKIKLGGSSNEHSH